MAINYRAVTISFVVGSVLGALNIFYQCKNTPKVVSVPLPNTPLEVIRGAPPPSKQEVCTKTPNCMLLAEAAYFEARSESDEGAVAVMYTIINRVEDNRFPDTISEVVNQYKQYSYIWDGSLSKGFRDKKQLDRMLKLAYDVRVGIAEDPTEGATFYHTKSVNPYWNREMAVVAVIDRHIFYKGF